MKRYVIGDIHGRATALKEVLTLCNFDYTKDKLIVLGDVVDGGTETKQVVDELLNIKNLIYIMGNHDEWFINHMNHGFQEEIWLQQGGAETLRSYGAKVHEAELVTDDSVVDNSHLCIPVTHQEFFNTGKLWYIEDKMLFIHAGLNPKIPKIESQRRVDLLWDRNLIEFAKKKTVPEYKKVFIGHTTTQTQGRNPFVKDCMAPIWYHNLCMMDTGAGWSGKLSLMDIDSGKYWCSKIQNPTQRTRNLSSCR